MSVLNAKDTALMIFAAVLTQDLVEQLWDCEFRASSNGATPHEILRSRRIVEALAGHCQVSIPTEIEYK